MTVREHDRKQNLAALRAGIGLPIELVTPANLNDWVVAGHPLHPAYNDLSLVHRSDYLRAYLLHHHGGGYCDLKRPIKSWADAFARAEADAEAWVVSYASSRADWAAKAPGLLGRDLLRYHQRLLGNGAYLVRPHTPFTAEWLREVERRLDYYAPQAAEFPGGVRGEVVGYPVSWNQLLSTVFNPLTLKYLDHIRQDDDLLLEFTDYQ